MGLYDRLAESSNQELVATTLPVPGTQELTEREARQYQPCFPQAQELGSRFIDRFHFPIGQLIHRRNLLAKSVTKLPSIPPHDWRKDLVFFDVKRA